MQGVAAIVLAIPFGSYRDLASLFRDVPGDVVVIDTSNYYPFRDGAIAVRAYQLHLVGLKRFWTHINQVTCALRFFFAVTLGGKEAIERIISAREPLKKPLVLSVEEVVRFLEAVPALRDRVALTTPYAAGLRVGEVSRLMARSIDSKRMLILIVGGRVT